MFLVTAPAPASCAYWACWGGKRQQERSQELEVEELSIASASSQTSNVTLNIPASTFRLCQV